MTPLKTEELEILSRPEWKSLSYASTSRPADEVEVRVLRTIEELNELREVWNSWCDDPNADLAYYLATASCRTDFVRPHVIVVFRDGQPDCMLVGKLEFRRLPFKIGYATVFASKVKRFFFLQGGFLGKLSRENCRLVARELKQCLERREAEMAEFIRLNKDSELSEALESEFGSLQRGHFTPIHEHRWVELPETFEGFLHGLSRKSRHELRRHEKKLSKEFGDRAHIHCYRHADEVEELAEVVEKVSAKTYQRALNVGFKPDVEVLESLRVAACTGGLRGCVLYLDEKPSAFFIGKQYKETFHGTYMGYDPEFSKYSPGMIVLMHSIEECFDPKMKATQFDLGWGDRQYKRAVCNQTRQDGPKYLYAPSLTGLKLNLFRSLTHAIDGGVRTLVEKSGFLQQMKKSWQRTRRKKSEFRVG